MGPQGPSLLLEQFGPLQGVRVLSEHFTLPVNTREHP